jgi:glycerate kinase
MAAALGVRLLDRAGRPIARGARGLLELESLDVASVAQVRRRLARARLEVACDVENPLLGPTGAAAVFGRQKFARPDEVSAEELARLEEALRRLARAIQGSLGLNVGALSGGGAAGGLAAGLAAFLGARLRPGIELVLRDVGLAEALDDAALVVTGEGKLDAQSRAGKAPWGVAREAKKRGLPVVALVGQAGPEATALVEQGVFDAIWPVVREGVSLERSRAEPAAELTRLAREVAPRLLALAGEKDQAQ